MAKKKAAKKASKSGAKGKSSNATVRGSGMAAKRADLGAGVEFYFAKLESPHRPIAERLHAVITKAAPKATHAVKWGMPVYEHHGMLCYIRSRPTYVTIGFYEQGVHLDEPRGLLEGTGDNCRHIKLGLADPVDEKYLAGLVKQAVKFNEMHGT